MKGYAKKRMRATSHHGRIGTTKHNARLFDLAKAEHINVEKLGLNYYWFFDGFDLESSGVEQGSPEFMAAFETSELRFYKQKFGKSLHMQNERYKAQRHPERCRTMEQVLQTKNKSPVETILQIGDIANTIDPSTFETCVRCYLDRLMEWGENNGGCYQPIDLAIHFDEKSPHAHLRGTFVWYDDDGIAHMGQDEALKRAGIELPDPEKKRGQYNNRKMTFDHMLREWWIEIAEAHGFEIEKEPIKGAEHLPVKAYKAKKDAEKNAKAKEAQLEAGERAVEAEAARLEDRERAVQAEIAQLEAREKDIEERAAQLEAREEEIEKRTARLEVREETIRAKTVEMDYREISLNKAQKTVEELIEGLKMLRDKYEKIIKNVEEKGGALMDWAKRRKAKEDGRTVWDLFQKDMERRMERREQEISEATARLATTRPTTPRPKISYREMPTIQAPQHNDGMDFGS